MSIVYNEGLPICPHKCRHYARFGKIDEIKFLYKSGKLVLNDVIFDAVKFNHLIIVEFCLNMGYVLSEEIVQAEITFLNNYSVVENARLDYADMFQLLKGTNFYNYLKLFTAGCFLKGRLSNVFARLIL